MFFMFACLAGWFLTDGYVFWPKEAVRYTEFAELRNELVEAGRLGEDAHGEDSQELRLAWERHAREMGYKRNFPSERTDASIREQRVIGWVLMAGAAIFGAWIAWNHKLRVRAEGNVVIGVSGQRVELDSIIAIDRKKWKKKGIAYAIYESEGKQRRLCLDDHKFAGCEAIILEAERRIKERSNSSE
ncbi:hypothetical protein [Coraliomargarita parva]|uniref:hypothetical protein n=1 Tax=Coraliomargarita parva TaxID=3014050 RepID=UPI0022B3DEBE|nr:hypothetical protein [Coraliomargarita parva]